MSASNDDGLGAWCRRMRDRFSRPGARGRSAELPDLRFQRAAGLGVDGLERRSRGRRDDRGDEALHERRGAEHDRSAGCRELERHSRAEHGGAEVHHHQHALGRSQLVDRCGDGHGIRPRHASRGARRDAQRGGESPAISSARSTAARARAGECETTTMPITSASERVGQRAQQQRGRRRRRGRGGPRCARRGSSRVPSAPRAGSSRRGPLRRRRPRPRTASAAVRPAATEASHASTAGDSASNIVLSPASALPRATMPSTPARSAAPRPAASTDATGAGVHAHPQEERPVQRTAGAADTRHERHPDALEEVGERLAATRCRAWRRRRSCRAPCSRRGRHRRSPSRARSARSGARRRRPGSRRSQSVSSADRRCRPW